MNGARTGYPDGEIRDKGDCTDMDRSRSQGLRFPQKGGFKILQLTDLHLSYRRRAVFKDMTLKFVRDAVRDEAPDLVVVTGDMVWSPFTERAYGEFAALMDAFAQPWTFVFGNHDRDFVFHTEVLEAAARRSRFCLYDCGDERTAGNGNYTLSLYDGDGRLCWMLYFLDTGDVSHYPRVRGYSHIVLSQLDWFYDTSRQIRRQNSGFASLVFMHKAIPEFRDMWEQGGCRGVRYEPEGCSLVNPGLFCALVEDGTVRGVFVGHDHGNNYTGTYCGIRLTYGAITGYNNFARNGLGRDLLRGARVIQLDRRGDFCSYFYCADNRRRDEEMCLME